MKKALFLSILSVLLVSCGNKNNGSIERFYYENVELTPPEDNSGAYVTVEPGSKTAIRFAYIHPDEEFIADDELAELFWIELPANMTEFSITTGDDVSHSEIELFYVRSCFCYFEQPFTFSRKNVSGQKIAPNQWRISFDIAVEFNENEYVLKDNGTYALSTFDN